MRAAGGVTRGARGRRGARPAAGFTLLEVLAASTIFAIIMVAVYMMYETNQNMFVNGEARATAQQNARVAMDDIVTAVRTAGFFHPDAALCRPPGSVEAIRIATEDTLSLHGGYRDPPGAGPNQDCNVYVTYSLWDGAGSRGMTLHKEVRRDDWARGQLTQSPLAENVTRLAFRYYDANGQQLPTTLPPEVAPACVPGFPEAWPRRPFALDAQGPVVGAAVPAAVPLNSQRDTVRVVRIEVTVETNIAAGSDGCYRRNVGGTTQTYTLVSEAHVRSLTP